MPSDAPIYNFPIITDKSLSLEAGDHLRSQGIRPHFPAVAQNPNTGRNYRKKQKAKARQRRARERNRPVESAQAMTDDETEGFYNLGNAEQCLEDAVSHTASTAASAPVTQQPEEQPSVWTLPVRSKDEEKIHKDEYKKYK